MQCVMSRQKLSWSVFVTDIQTGVIQEERIQFKKCLYWIPLGKFVGHFLN